MNEKRLGFLVWILSFLVYAFTLCPTISSGDSGELITAAYTLGVPHAPGYPLYCLLGKLFTFIPLGSVALRVNLMSAFFAASAVTLIYFIIFLLTKVLSPESTLINRFLPSLVGSLCFAYSETFWSQAVDAEVYTLFVFFIALSFYTLLKWTREPTKISLLYWFSLFYGLTVTCHQLALFFAPGFFLLILFYQPKIFFKPKNILIMLLLFILGLTVYLYIPLRALANPLLNWSKVDSLDSFIRYLTRQQYGSIKNNYDVDLFVKHFYVVDFTHLKKLLFFLEKEFRLIWIIGFFGFIPLILKARRYLWVFMVIFIMAIIKIWMVIAYTDKVLYIGRVYLLGGFIIIAVMLGLGLFYIVETALACKKKFLYFILLVIIALLPVISLLGNYARNDQSENYVIYDYGRNVLDTLDKDAVLLGEGDSVLFSLLYLTVVEKMRPDVKIYDDIAGDVFRRTPISLFMLDAKGKDEVIDVILKDSKRPLYITLGNSIITTTKHKVDLVGIIYKVLRENDKIEPGLRDKAWKMYRLVDIFDGRLQNKDYLSREVIASYHIAFGAYIFPRSESLGVAAYHRAGEILRDSKLIRETLAMFYSFSGRKNDAIDILKKAAKEDPDDPNIHYNLGVAYAKFAKYNEAITSWHRALELKPNFRSAQEYIKKAESLLGVNKSLFSPLLKEDKGDFRY